MASSTPGRKKVREYLPPRLQLALNVTRLANAISAREGESKFRYVVDSPIHEGVDPNINIRIFDSFMGLEVSTSELLQRLPEDMRKRVLHSYL